MATFIGIDISTTATKALLLDDNGAVLGVAAAEYPYDTPRPLWAEQSPDLWWQATVAALRRLWRQSHVAPGEIAGIGLTGQMHGLVLLDADGRVLRPAILWNDQRTGAECEEMRVIFGRKSLIALTGNDALPGFTAPKLLWVKNHEPDIYRRIAHVLLPKDYVRYKLTGGLAMDKADGAGTQLFDLRRRDWSAAVLAGLGVSPVWLPPTFEGTEVTGSVSAEAAAATGLMAGIPVVAGGGDQAATAVGVGAITDGVVALSLGTSGVVFASAERSVIDPEGRLHAFCHAVPGQWHLMGVMLSAGGSLRWYRETLAPECSYDELTAAAADIPPGSDGLFFLPYLTGERTPHPDPLARGAFIGLTVRHTRAHLTRAVLEGVAFGLRDNLELMQQVGLAAVAQIRAAGGGARSPLWRQILADVLGADIAGVNTTEGAAYGAALLAAVGVGAFPTVSAACAAWVRVTDSLPPGPNRARYAQLYPVYRALYPALQATFAAIAQSG